jgi:hypothetical protein
MMRWGSLVLLPWALWPHVETATVPATGTPVTTSDAIERFATYEACKKAARWAESQPDLREEWMVTWDGQRFDSTMIYECRQGGR